MGMNPMMRMGQGNGMGGPQVMPGQGMQGMPPNMQQGPGGQQQVVGGGAGLPPNAVQQQQVGGMNPMGVGMGVNMPPNLQQKPNMTMGQAGQMFPGNRGGVVGVGGQQQPGQPFMRSSPSPADAQQLQQQQQQQQAQLQHMQQQQLGNQTPTQQPPTPQQMPTPNMIPSPALVPQSSPQMMQMQNPQQRNNIRQQSPSASINTPGQVTGNSPFNPQEEALYREKYKQLTKYIEPLKRMLAKISNDGTSKYK